MKKEWIIFFIIIGAGVLLSAFFSARPQVITDTPTETPLLRELVPPGTQTRDVYRAFDEAQAPTLIQPTPLVRVTTQKLLERACNPGTDHCKLQSIYDFVRTNIEFSERTPEETHIRSPAELLLAARGNEFEIAMLIASMQRAAGFKNEIVRSPISTWVRVTSDNRTIMIDPSCQGCGVMEAKVSLRGDEIVYG